MIVEYIRYKLPAADSAAFEHDYARAAASLAASPFCLGYELSRCSEEPGVYVLRIRWTSADDHLQGFRRSEHFPPFLAAIRPYVPQIEEMRHYEPTRVVGGTVD
ncbi:Quinol monooxygenase YgiN [Dyella sp. OK004]|uniref:putative quinol monooxygenase n=1 Tax=Dyella sp. OK004 TaxID=1855292 RepID=UPI0008EE1564|nr:antibiotic biosynthesis monooxygenase family protein [Dyella sp. OK004]SFS19166.1 Quinol monooxygenase YgiN [Dyella sp. OK004]